MAENKSNLLETVLAGAPYIEPVPKLPALPKWSNSWPIEVQTKWLEAWCLAIGYFSSKVEEVEPL